MFSPSADGSLVAGYKIYTSKTATAAPTITGYSPTAIAISFTGAIGLGLAGSLLSLALILQ